MDALRRSLEAADVLYRHFNFLPWQPRRLFLPMKTVAALFGRRLRAGNAQTL